MQERVWRPAVCASRVGSAGQRGRQLGRLVYMLLGRDEERLALDHLLAEARQGHSGVLALVGEPGIGKTMLLEYAAERAHGMRVLRARGVESETQVAFAGLAELLRPALTAFDRIPGPQATALAGALALGPATAQDRFTVGAATLSLLSACAEEAPLALLVDDAHLLDGSSAEALRFAARRLLADPIALILTVREGEPSLLDGADLRVLRVAGLDRSDSAELLERIKVPRDAVEHLHRATGGNPLALLELAPEAARLTTLPGEGPVPISTSIAAAFLRRFERLPVQTRRVLVLAAASDAGDLTVLARAASSIGLDVGDLAAAEEADLVTLEHGEVEFRHPLARSAVYADAPAPERREAHAALAGALPDRDVDRRAWHLAAASVGPNDRASAALEQAGVRARERTAYPVAAAAFERGAQLACADDARGRLLLAAADSAWLGGNPERTLVLLAEAHLHATDPLLAARVDRLRGHVTMRCGPVMDGYPLIVSAAEEIAETDPELAVVMLAEAVHGCFYAGDTPAMVSAAERAVALAQGQSSRRATFFAAMAHGMALVANGHGDTGAVEARRAVAILERSDELRDDARLLIWAALGPMWLREADAGHGLADRAFERARTEAAVGVLPALLHHFARDQATTDRWRAAEANYDEAIRLARETGQRTELAAALAGLTWLQARQGRESACREHAAEAAALCAELGMGLYGIWAIQALGDLELGLGRPAAAAEHHEVQADKLRSRGIADVDLSPAPELVDAYLRLGRSDDAAAVAADFVVAAEAKGQPWALARAARCRGLLAGAGQLEACFEEALELHQRTPDGFEAGRTRLAYGARLRRVRKRVRAREELRAALEIFERLGARPWAEQASAELAVTGETARRRDASTLDQLTPQELQIARLLADGKTTREAAAAIFLSPKTIEYHLAHVYRKLGINSRDALGRILRAPR
jgi:DNA-binding CsgD family transcriptional regulator